jgi:hypothetical protein
LLLGLPPEVRRRSSDQLWLLPSFTCGHSSGGSTAPGNLAAFDIDGCETWLLWAESVDDVDPEYAILYEVHVSGVFDGAQLDTDRWVTYGTEFRRALSPCRRSIVPATGLQ